MDHVRWRKRSARRSPQAFQAAVAVAAAILSVRPALDHEIAPPAEAALQTPPVILSLDPAPASLDVSTSQVITVEFDQTMDSVSLNDATIRVVGERHGPYDGLVSVTDLPGFHAAHFGPATPFSIGEKITVLVTSQVKSAQQVPVFPPVAWTFTTECQPGPLSFAQDSVYYAARLPFELCMADVNRDGFDDFAIAHTPAAAGTLSVFTSAANGTLDFAVSTLLRTTKGPRGIHCIDLTGDRFLDIVMSTTNDSTFVTLANDGFGAFADTTTYDPNLLAYTVYGFDLDMDGDTDVAASNLQGPQILLAVNDGTGALGSFTTIVADSSPRNMEAADLDEDGDLDLIAVNPNGKVSVFPALSAGVFATDTTYAVGQRPLSLYVNDLNGDGFLDAVVSNVQGGSLSLLFNRGDGTFGEDSVVVIDSINVGAGKNTLFDVCGNDYDGDGDIDLATANWFTGRLFVLENDGLGHFDIAMVSDSIGVGLQGVVSGDPDRDGDIDLIVTNWATGKLYVLRNGPSGLAIVDRSPLPYRIDAAPPFTVQFSSEIQTGALNDSTVSAWSPLRGRVAAALSYSVSNRTLQISPAESLLPGEEMAVTLEAGIQALAGPSLAPTTWTFSLASGPGGSQFQVVQQVAVPFNSKWVLPVLIDANALLDIVTIQTSPGGIQTFLNQGGYVFSSGPSVTLGIELGAATPADLDGDGDIDFVVADAGSGTLLVVGNDGGALLLGGTGSASGPASTLQSADLNADGMVDVIGLLESPQSVEIWTNLGGGGLSLPATVPIPAGPRAAVTLDSDLDGDMDLAVVCQGPASVALLANTAGVLSLDTLIALPAGQPVDIEVGDITEDGYPDILIADKLVAAIRVLASTGNGGFALQGPIALGLAPIDLRIADLNGDAALDIASVSPDGQSVTSLYGLGSGLFGVDSIYTLAIQPTLVSSGMLGPSGRIDLIAGSPDEPTLAILANDPPTAVPVGGVPPRTVLHAARPNPANPSAEIRFDLSRSAHAILRVFDASGALVRVLIDQPMTEGAHRVTWDGHDRGGEPVASGVYMYRLEAGGDVESRKLVILR
jgi:hypothetical protein